MPICPSCSQEYESFVTACPDCGVALVLSLEPAAATPGRLRLALVLAADRQLAEAMAERLQDAGLPVGAPETPPAGLPADTVPLLVPADFYRQALAVLEADSQLVRELVALEAAPGEEADTLPLFRRYDPQRDGVEVIRNPEILRRSLEELLERQDEVIGELLDCIRRGDDVTRDGAIRVVREMGETGVEALISMAAALARETRRTALLTVLNEIRERVDDPARLAPILAVAADTGLDAEPRGLALHAVGRFELPAVYEQIVPLLCDLDPRVREDADEALCMLSDEDMGFDPELPEAKRQECQRRWREWFERRR